MARVTILLAGVVGLLVVGPARALVVAPPPPLSDRLAQADVVVLGKIVGMEKDEVTFLPYKNAPKKTTYRIALLKVAEVIKGAKAQETLRLGFVALLAPKSGGGVIRPKGVRFGLTFKVGDEGLFYLTRHFQEPLFLTPRYYDFVSGQNPNFPQDMDLVRCAMKLGTQLVAGLESKDRQERFYAAGLLIQRYRTFRGGTGKFEPIDARESRLILAALSEADWDMDGQMTPWTLFLQLGVKKEDGWEFRPTKVPAGGYPKAAQSWLRQHAATFRIHRVLPPEASPGP
jgi:hypothetical protein